MPIESPKKKEESAREFKIDPELDDQLEAFMKANPDKVKSVKELPREQLEREFLLRKMWDEKYDAKIRAWLEKPEQAELIKSWKETMSPNMKPEKEAQTLVNRAKTTSTTRVSR